MKFCKKCQQDKPKSSFYKSNRGGGYRWICKLCEKEYKRLSRQKTLIDRSKYKDDKAFLKERLLLIKLIAYKKWPKKFDYLFETDDSLQRSNLLDNIFFVD